VWARSPPMDFEGASMPAAGAAASTGRFEAGPPLRWERGAGERGRRNGSPGCPRTSAVDLVHTWGTPFWDVSASPLALSGVVADVGQGVDSPQLSIEPARKDEGIEAIPEGFQGGEL
jgi:hypothetical protein